MGDDIAHDNSEYYDGTHHVCDDEPTGRVTCIQFQVTVAYAINKVIVMAVHSKQNYTYIVRTYGRERLDRPVEGG